MPLADTGIPGFTQALMMTRSGICGSAGVVIGPQNVPVCGTGPNNQIQVTQQENMDTSVAAAPTVAVTTQGTPLTTAALATGPSPLIFIIGGAGLLVVLMMMSSRR